MIALNDRAMNLNALSDKYKKNTHKLNLQATYAKIGAVVIFLVLFLLVIKYYVF
jgi:hypothetical protein